MASIQWTPPEGWIEETGAHVLMLAPCDCTVTSTLTIGANAYTIVDATGASFATRGGVFVTGALIEFVIDVDAKKAYLLNQGGPQDVPGKPKLLWEGSFSSGSITVPGYSDYAIFAFVSSASDNIIYLIGGNWAGVGGFGLYGSNYPNVMSYRFGVSGDTLSIDTYNKGISSWDVTTGSTRSFATTKIFGLVLKSDIQEA